MMDRCAVARCAVGLVVLSAMMTGCGGGTGKSADTSPPTVSGAVLYTGTVEEQQMTPTDREVPVVHPSTTLRVTATLTDSGGIDTSKPPSIGLFATYGGAFNSGKFIAMGARSDTSGGWQADLDFTSVDPGQAHPSAYVTVVLRATDKAGNELITTLGTFYYSNP